VMIIPENTLFDARTERDVPHFWIHFAPPLSLRFMEGQFCLPLEPSLAGNIAEVKERLQVNPQTKAERHQIFHLCLAVLHSCFARTALRLEAQFPPALGIVLETIERSLARPLGNEDLARLAGMNRDGFIRWFKSFMKTTPARYVTRRRIREACRYLSLTSHSIEQIAENLGFADRHHFTRLFVREIGRGPAEFRRRSLGR
jgi:transcriptional regulator GlxA family with amidase domain